MWFRRRRRRHPPPHLLSSLDRLSELVTHVVDLVDGLVIQERKPPQAEPEWHVQPVDEELALQEHELSAEGWVGLAAIATGYRLVERNGSFPARGDSVEIDGARFRVLRLGPSPLPGDARRCAFLEREEPPDDQRNDDP